MHKCPCGKDLENKYTSQCDDLKTYQFLRCEDCGMKGRAYKGQLIETWTEKRKSRKNIVGPEVFSDELVCSRELQSLIRPIAGLTA